MQPPGPSSNSTRNGQTVVLILLVLGLAGALFLSRNIPRRNPKLSDPGSPYYSPPNDDEIKAMRELELKQSR
jgi:hypothetical protein